MQEHFPWLTRDMVMNNQRKKARLIPIDEDNCVGNLEETDIIQINEDNPLVEDAGRI